MSNVKQQKLIAMKTIIIALAFAGITLGSAEAQTKTVVTTTTTRTCACDNAAKKTAAKPVARTTKKATATKKTNAASTYQVCREENGYYTCCVRNAKMSTKK
jgi:hypothetical protein